MPATIRLATTRDAARIQAIYASIVRDTAISFELEPPDEAEMARRVAETLDRLPWLVSERDGEIIGYAYAAPHRTRAAYQWSVDVSAYVRADARRSGVGRALYAALLPILRLQGYCNAYAGIALPNPGSVRLHEACGFTPVGVYRRVGFKHGAWHDVGWWQLALRDGDAAPDSPLMLGDVVGTDGWNEALAGGG